MAGKVISISNLKGGVGKTTSSANLGGGLARMGYKVLIIDWDYQGNLSSAFGLKIPVEDAFTLMKAIDPEREDTNFINIEQLKAYNVGLYENRLKVLYTDKTLLAFERVVNSDPRLEQERYFILGYAIEFLKEHYDFILIDCLPSLGTMAVNAYAASDYVITPMEVGKFNRDSWEDVQDAISRVQRKTNPKLKLLGTFLTKDSPKTKISVQTKELFKEGRMGKLFRSSIRDNVAVCLFCC